MSLKIEAINSPPIPEVKIEDNNPKKIPRAEAIRICKEKYPSDFKKKKILTLAIAIGALALFAIPLIAAGVAALSLCTFEIALLFVTPVSLIAIGILIKKIDDYTLYWSGNLARILIAQKEKEAQKAADKAKKEAEKAKKVDIQLEK